MTTDPIQHLRELLAKATPGPWNNDDQQYLIECAHGLEIAKTDGINDANLIVAAINALPALLAVAEAARKATQGIGNLCEFDAIGYSRLGDLESLEDALAKLDEVKHD